jgi:hypothetical protein
MMVRDLNGVYRLESEYEAGVVMFHVVRIHSLK